MAVSQRPPFWCLFYKCLFFCHHKRSFLAIPIFNIIVKPSCKPIYIPRSIVCIFTLSFPLVYLKIVNLVRQFYLVNLSGRLAAAVSQRPPFWCLFYKCLLFCHHKRSFLAIPIFITNVKPECKPINIPPIYILYCYFVISSF